MKYIAIIETSDVGARYTGEACRRLGLEPLFLFQKDNYQADTLSQLYEFSYIETQTSNAELLGEVVRNSSFDIMMVTTFLDSRLGIAAELASILNIPGLPLELCQLKDKHQVYLMAPNLFPSSIDFNRKNYNLESLLQFRNLHGKVILKPRNTAGGLGMKIVNSDAELISSLEAALSFQAAPHLKADDWMIQAFKEGQLISIEGFVFNGKVQCWGATGRHKVGNTESIAYFPHEIQSENNIKHSTYLRMQEQISKLFEVLKIKNTFFHIEFIMTEQGESFIIDPNIGRIGGGGLLEVLALSFKVSPVDVCEFVLKLSLMEELLIDSPLAQTKRFAELMGASTLMYGSQSGGKLDQVQIPNEFPFYHTQILNNGVQVPAMGTDNWAWIGILSVPSREVAYLQKTIKLSINNKQEELCF